MPTHVLFRSIEIFFRHPSEKSLADAKAVCSHNHPLNILLRFEYKLNKTDSIYYKSDSIYYEYLKLFNFKSEYANLLVKQFERIVNKLIFAYGFCYTFVMNNTTHSIKHMGETARSVLTLIREQRKEVPNKLTPDIISRYVSELVMMKCSAEAPHTLNNNYQKPLICASHDLVIVSIFYLIMCYKISYKF